MTRERLRAAVAAALAGDWAGAHSIVQADEADPIACWVHAVLHKIEGDDDNARFWYRRAGRMACAERQPTEELTEIQAALAD